MDSIKLINTLFDGNHSAANELLENIIRTKIDNKLAERKIDISYNILSNNIEEDKNPSRINNLEAQKILKGAGYVSVRSGKHQSIWKHPTDTTKEMFPLPHHSRELSPGLTRKIFSLTSEDTLVSEELKGFKLKRHRLGTGENKHKSAKVYSSADNNKHQVHYYSNNQKIETENFDNFNDADEDASTYVNQ